MKVLFAIAIAMVAGLFMSRIVKPLKLPAVTGYIIAGILIGPYGLGALGLTGLFCSLEEIESLEIISDVALGFIAFSIGTEFKMSSLKKTGRQATIVGCVQALAAMVLVDGALIGLHFVLGEDKLPLSVAITLGAIATATAPAATMMVVKQYKAKGTLTSILLPIVALDDAVGLILFSISIGVAQAVEGGSVSIINLLVNPLLEVVLSLLLGTLVGVIFSYVEKTFKSNSKRLCISITFVFLTIALSQLSYTFANGVKLESSSLLVCMMLGTVFCNICASADELMARTDKWSMPVLVLFFVISGAQLQFNIFSSAAAIIIGVTYIIFRSAGKYIGSFVSARATGCEPNIVKYLGITLLPQAGVSIGMSLTAAAVLANGTLVRNIILMSVLFYEMVGPLFTKMALTKAGDITPKETAAKRLTVAEAFADDLDDDQGEKTAPEKKEETSIPANSKP